MNNELKDKALENKKSKCTTKLCDNERCTDVMLTNEKYIGEIEELKLIIKTLINKKEELYSQLFSFYDIINEIYNYIEGVKILDYESQKDQEYYFKYTKRMNLISRHFNFPKEVKYKIKYIIKEIIYHYDV